MVMGHEDGEDVAGIRVVYLGMRGRFSGSPFLRLYEAGLDVRGLVVPALPGGPPYSYPSAGYRPRSPLLMMADRPVAPSVVDLARGAAVAIFEVERFDQETVETLTALKPDVVAVACFPLRLPDELLRLPRLGCLNVHPALLPENRGPDPLFWTFRHGDRTTGVTVHLMDEGLDSGPIVLQRAVEVREGITEAQLEAELAELGAELLARAIRGIAGGSVTPMPQDAARATNYGFPTANDFTIRPDRPARWAYDFARGVGGREQAVVVAVGDERFPVAEALGYDADATLDSPHIVEHDLLRLRCSPGVFSARLLTPHS